MNTFHVAGVCPTTDVAPVLIVDGVAWTGLKLPAALSRWKKLTPSAMLPGDPPSARFTIITPCSAAFASVGLPLSATAFLNFGPSSWLTDVIVPTFFGLYPIDMKPP